MDKESRKKLAEKTVFALYSNEHSDLTMNYDGCKPFCSRSKFTINPHDIGFPDVDPARHTNTRGAKLMRSKPNIEKKLIKKK